MGQTFAKTIFDADLEDYNRVGFSDGQLRIIKQKFKEVCHPDAALNSTKFSKLINLTPELAKPIFEFIDMAEDQWIDDYEFICALALFAKTTVDERLRAIYTLYDTDKSNI